MQALQDGVVVESPTVPYVDFWRLGKLSCSDKVASLIRNRQTKHLRFMLEIEPLDVKSSVVEDDHTGSEVDDLLTVNN